MKRILITTVFSLSFLFLFASDKGKGDDVTLEQLQATEHQSESDAPAAYLINKATMSYNFNSSQGPMLQAEYHFRIKIYNDEGEDYSEFDIGVYGNGGKKEKVSSIKAFTYNEVNGAIEKTKLAKEDIFREETNEDWRSVKFALPKVKSGSIIDVKYTISSPYFWILPRFYFQKFIPVDHAEYSLAVPQYFNMAPVPKGSVELEHTSHSSSSSGFQESVNVFKSTNIPSIDDDDYVLNINDYRGSVKYEISSIDYPGRARQVITGSWKTLGAELMEDGLGGGIGKHGKAFDAIIAGVQGATADEKLAYIYQYVRDQYKWNGNVGIYPSQKQKALLETKIGSVGDLNILLINLLRKAGIQADPIATRTRRAGLLNVHFPSRDELNYLLVQVNYKGQPTLLDATSKYNQIGQLPIRAVNINGIRLTKEGGESISIRNDNEYNQKYVADYTVDLDNEVVNGECQVKLTKFGAIKYRQELDEKNEELDEDNQDLEDEEYADEEEEEEEDVQVDNEITITSSKGIEDKDAAVGYTFTEVNHKIMSSIGDELFIDADFDFGIKKNPFTEETREYPAFFNYKLNLTKIAKLNIPEGYVLKSVPENASLSLPEKLGRFKYMTTEKDGVLTVQYMFRINRDYFLPQQYPALKQLFNMVIAKQNEKIVLAKSGM